MGAVWWWLCFGEWEDPSSDEEELDDVDDDDDDDDDDDPNDDKNEVDIELKDSEEDCSFSLLCFL